MTDNDEEPSQVPAAYRRSGKTSATSGEASDSGKGMALYHVMRRTETFEETAGMLWVMVRETAPEVPRQASDPVHGH